METGIVNIRGKEYKTVALRIAEFREQYPDYCIETEVLSAAELVSVRAVIKNTEGHIKATGTAEELRDSTNINKTSALENCETSAVGRALAFFGFAGSEIASADEVANAITQQAEKDAFARAAACARAVRDNWASIEVMQRALAADDYSTAKEAWREVTEADQHDLWLATTKGGIFTTREREQMKSDEWRNA